MIMLFMYFFSGIQLAMVNIISENMCKSARNIIGQEFAYKEEGAFFSFYFLKREGLSLFLLLERIKKPSLPRMKLEPEISRV